MILGGGRSDRSSDVRGCARAPGAPLRKSHRLRPSPRRRRGRRTSGRPPSQAAAPRHRRQSAMVPQVSGGAQRAGSAPTGCDPLAPLQSPTGSKASRTALRGGSWAYGQGAQEYAAALRRCAEGRFRVECGEGAPCNSA
eukprot:scaffold75510_cov26-Tisochrysis_lutea.AAC.2